MYRSLIGSLKYLLHTIHELTYSMCYLSRFIEEPNVEHLSVVKRVLRYVAGTLDYGLLYPRGYGQGFKILRYSDSDFAGDIDNSTSTSGMIFFLDDGAATWNSQKQKIVTLSLCEAEYIAGSMTNCQAVWMARLLEEIMGTELPRRGS
jgi:hypothetical protein